jgi:hypothetical protein
MPMVSPEPADSTEGSNALAPRIFREHGLISRLQGKARNRRDPAGTKGKWAACLKRKSKGHTVNVGRESDRSILVRKLWKAV